MTMTRQDVEHIALLSRLALSPEEVEAYTRRLQEILEYARQIQKLPTDDVEPMSHPMRIRNVMRAEDRIGVMLSVEEALSNAPDRADAYFRVPKVTESA